MKAMLRASYALSVFLYTIYHLIKTGDFAIIPAMIFFYWLTAPML